MEKGTIRPAILGDEFFIHQLIRELALYEKAPNEVDTTAEDLRVHLFEEKICEAIVLEYEGAMVGFALYYSSYSTWKGKCLYLEDFYVIPTLRGKGLGGLLFEEIVAIAKRKQVKRMDWQVLNWNQPAIQFYKKMNTDLDGEWINGRIYF
jgi:GNAT superfamily N-acetyltransferase